MITRSLLKLVAGSPVLIPYFLVGIRRVNAAFDSTVAPMVRQVFADPGTSDRICRSLLGTSAKIGLAMWGYSRLTRVPFNPTAIALGSSYTRVYDDLIDNFSSPGTNTDARLDDLFHGRTYVPTIELERLLLLLYHTIESTLRPPFDGTLYHAMRHLHRYQCKSRRQRQQITAAEVHEITLGKGGYGLVALFALLRPDPTEAEHELLIQLGDVLQLLDDHHDFPLDLEHGIRTSVTLGQCTLPQLSRRIRRLGRDFHRYYRRRPVALWTTLHLMELGAYLVHRRFARGRRTSVPVPAGAGTLRLLFNRAENIRPPVASGRPSR